MLDGDWLEWRVDEGWGHFALVGHSDGEILQLEIETHVHPHEVDGHRDQAEAEVFGVDTDHGQPGGDLSLSDNVSGGADNPL